ncbi:N-acetyltransferase [Roseomonas sp. HF4]|uniref:GNAT family N-acetyltransferase n=1 Tax=Roseomonas sp. HF4 TaxID=2562313 RepID=UPI0010BFDF5E|nr:GNAT family N-acetyltransferase [Roseomonas sp. HF4]
MADPLAATLAAAFAADPLMAHALPDAAARARRLPRLFGAVLRACRVAGGVAAVGDGAAVAGWRRGDAVPAPAALLLRSGLVLAPALIGPGATRRLMAQESACEAAIREGFGAAPFAYLWAIGVAPARQGQGLGAEMLTQALAALPDRRWVLKTEREEVLPFYARAGFAPVRRITPEGGIPAIILAR